MGVIKYGAPYKILRCFQIGSMWISHLGTFMVFGWSGTQIRHRFLARAHSSTLCLRVHMEPVENPIWDPIFQPIYILDGPIHNCLNTNYKLSLGHFSGEFVEYPVTSCDWQATFLKNIIKVCLKCGSCGIKKTFCVCSFLFFFFSCRWFPFREISEHWFENTATDDYLSAFPWNATEPSCTHQQGFMLQQQLFKFLTCNTKACKVASTS